MQLIKIAYNHWNAEVVFITSNMQGNQEMMEGCKEAGIPAFVGILHSLGQPLLINIVGYSMGFLILVFNDLCVHLHRSLYY